MSGTMSQSQHDTTKDSGTDRTKDSGADRTKDSELDRTKNSSAVDTVEDLPVYGGKLQTVRSGRELSNYKSMDDYSMSSCERAQSSPDAPDRQIPKVKTRGRDASRPPFRRGKRRPPNRRSSKRPPRPEVLPSLSTSEPQRSSTRSSSPQLWTTSRPSPSSAGFDADPLVHDYDGQKFNGKESYLRRLGPPTPQHSSPDDSRRTSQTMWRPGAPWYQGCYAPGKPLLRRGFFHAPFLEWPRPAARRSTWQLARHKNNVLMSGLRQERMTLCEFRRYDWTQGHGPQPHYIPYYCASKRSQALTARMILLELQEINILCKERGYDGPYVTPLTKRPPHTSRRQHCPVNTSPRHRPHVTLPPILSEKDIRK